MRFKSRSFFILVVCIIVVFCLASSVIVFFIVSPASTLLSLSSEKNISGSVFDCDTKKPVSDATVSMSGNGWGFSGNQLVWDKSYTVSDQTNSNGEYNITFRLGRSLVVRKEGYLVAQNYVSAGKEVKVGLKKIVVDIDSSQWTYDCRLSSDCEKTVIKDGIEVSWNDCTNPELGEKYK